MTVKHPSPFRTRRALLADREDHDGDARVAHHRDRRGVHHPQVLGQHVLIRQTVIARGGLILLRIGGVDAVDAGALQKRVATHLGGAQRGAGIRREERRAHAGGEDHHPALFEVPQRAPADVGLGHRIHGQGALHPGLDADLLQRRLHGQGVHHRGQHAHVVGRGPVHVAGRLGQAAEDVPAADHQAHLDAALDRALDGGGHGVDRLHVDAIALIAHQDLARHLEQDSLEVQFCHRTVQARRNRRGQHRRRARRPSASAPL